MVGVVFSIIELGLFGIVCPQKCCLCLCMKDSMIAPSIVLQLVGRKESDTKCPPHLWAFVDPCHCVQMGGQQGAIMSPCQSASVRWSITSTIVYPPLAQSVLKLNLFFNNIEKIVANFGSIEDP